MTKDYYGTKRVTAWPQNKVSPYTTNPCNFIVKDGYAVKYADGYISWSPKDVFEAAYKPVDCMDFSGALAAMKAGHRVERRGVFGSIAIDEQFDLLREDILAEDWMIGK